MREIRVVTDENTFTISDQIENTGDKTEPFEILYHMNMGYPLLDEESIITVPSVEVIPRDEYAAEDLENWTYMDGFKAKLEKDTSYKGLWTVSFGLKEM